MKYIILLILLIISGQIQAENFTSGVVQYPRLYNNYDLNGHEYVDLGLPSGNIWATSNYGASSPAGYGLYQEWYQCGNVSSAWGSSWRTPSRSDMSELVDYCTWNWTTQNGVNGYKVIGTNGNSIFLPAAGFKFIFGGEAQALGEQLYYWTTTIGENSFSYALTASSSFVSTSYTYNTSITLCPIRPCADKVSSSVQVTSITLNQTSITLEKGQQFTLTATVTPSDATNKAVSWSTSNSSVATVNDGLITAVSAGSAEITAKTADGSNLSATCKVTVTDTYSGSSDASVLRVDFTYGKYGSVDKFLLYSLSDIESIEFVESGGPIAEAVDLGLPSGTKWASWNMGASAPEESGNYYAWGETEVKGHYDLDSYINYDSQTRKFYTPISISGTEYDVAHVKWGDPWKIPTVRQYRELLDYCKIKWTERNGVNGIMVEGPNGSSIFLPACGYCKDDDLLLGTSDNHYRCYSTSQVDKENDYNVWYFNFNGILCGDKGRYLGFSVRAVSQ